MKRKKILVASTSILLTLTACNSTDTSVDDDKIEVYTSFSAMTALVKPIVQDNVEVIQLINGNIEPHEYEPTAKDITRISEADLFVYNGLGFEHYMNKVEASVDSDVLFLETATKITDVYEGENGIDPHVWMNLDNAIKQAGAIVDDMSIIDIDNRDLYESNLQNFTDGILQLIAEYDEVLENDFDKTVVVVHPAYRYLFEPYGITQLAVQPDHETEPTSTQLKEVIEYIRDNDVKYIFSTSSDMTKTVETVVSETGVTVFVLDNLENIDIENITETTYIDVMRSNLEVLKNAKALQ